MLHTYATRFKRSLPIVTRNVTIELERRRPEVRGRHNRVAPIDVLRLVAGELHGHGARHRGPLHVADSRPTQIAAQHPRHARRLTGARPRPGCRPYTPSSQPLTGSRLAL